MSASGKLPRCKPGPNAISGELWNNVIAPAIEANLLVGLQGGGRLFTGPSGITIVLKPRGDSSVTVMFGGSTQSIGGRGGLYLGWIMSQGSAPLLPVSAWTKSTSVYIYTLNEEGPGQCPPASGEVSQGFEKGSYALGGNPYPVVF